MGTETLAKVILLGLSTEGADKITHLLVFLLKGSIYIVRKLLPKSQTSDFAYIEGLPVILPGCWGNMGKSGR